MANKAIPTALKLVRGVPGCRKPPADEPMPEVSLMRPPSYLDPIAVGEWEHTGPMLARMGLLTEADETLFAGYCMVVSDLVRINDAMAACGHAMVAIKTNVDGTGHESVEAKTNPLIVQRRQALTQLRFYCQEFGMTPSARGKMSIPDSGKVDPRTKYLNG